MSLFLTISSVQSQIIIGDDTTIPTVANGGRRAYLEETRLIKNDNSITIYGKIYWHYVKIDNVYYNCGDKEKIVKAIIQLNKKATTKNRVHTPFDPKKRIAAVDPKLLKNAAKPKPVKPSLTSSLRQAPRKLKP